jgi:hypothetical protein
MVNRCFLACAGVIGACVGAAFGGQLGALLGGICGVFLVFAFILWKGS